MFQIGTRSHCIVNDCEGMMIAQQRCWVCGKPSRPELSDTACSLPHRQLLYTESYRLLRWKQDAYQRGLASDLTLAQWAETLRYFKWKCAYCQGPFESVDHFLPAVLGGGTTVSNCVPSCTSCNRLKGGLAPDAVEALPHETIYRIQQYLERRVSRVHSV